MSDPGDNKRRPSGARREAARVKMAAADPDTDAAEVVVEIDGTEVRLRTRPEPVHSVTCLHCDNPFWFKKSHGWRTHDGKYASWRVPCGWCSKPQYIPIDDNDAITDEWIPSAPRRSDLRR